VVVSGRRFRLLGSPKRKLREYASLHRSTFRIPSARASGFKGIGSRRLERRSLTGGRFSWNGGL
jgi:hypothetical protein